MNDKVMNRLELLKSKREITGSEVFLALCHAKRYAKERDITDENMVSTFVLTSLFDPDVYPSLKRQAYENLKKAETVDEKIDDLVKTLAEALGVDMP